MGISCWTPPPLQQSLLYMAPVLEPYQVVSGLIPGVFCCWTPVQHVHFALSSEKFLPSQCLSVPELKTWFILTKINWILPVESIVIK